MNSKIAVHTVLISTLIFTVGCGKTFKASENSERQQVVTEYASTSTPTILADTEYSVKDYNWVLYTLRAVGTGDFLFAPNSGMKILTTLPDAPVADFMVVRKNVFDSSDRRLLCRTPLHLSSKAVLSSKVTQYSATSIPESCAYNARQDYDVEHIVRVKKADGSTVDIVRDSPESFCCRQKELLRAEDLKEEILKRISAAGFSENALNHDQWNYFLKDVCALKESSISAFEDALPKLNEARAFEGQSQVQDRSEDISMDAWWHSIRGAYADKSARNLKVNGCVM